MSKLVINNVCQSIEVARDHNSARSKPGFRALMVILGKVWHVCAALATVQSVCPTLDGRSYSRWHACAQRYPNELWHLLALSCNFISLLSVICCGARFFHAVGRSFIVVYVSNPNQVPDELEQWRLDLAMPKLLETVEDHTNLPMVTQQVGFCDR